MLEVDGSILDIKKLARGNVMRSRMRFQVIEDELTQLEEDLANERDRLRTEIVTLLYVSALLVVNDVDGTPDSLALDEKIDDVTHPMRTTRYELIDIGISMQDAIDRLRRGDGADSDVLHSLYRYACPAGKTGATVVLSLRDVQEKYKLRSAGRLDDALVMVANAPDSHARSLFLALFPRAVESEADKAMPVDVYPPTAAR